MYARIAVLPNIQRSDEMAQNTFGRMQPYGMMQRNLLRDVPAATECNMTQNVYDETISSLPEQTPIGMAYVPYEQWETPYSVDTGFPIGTIFSPLDKPFQGGGCRG